MNENDKEYFRSFPYQLENMVDAFLFTDGLNLDEDRWAESIKNRLHMMRWEIRTWLESQ